MWDRIHGKSLFDRDQYIQGESGYVNAPHMVCAYKMTMHEQDREDFNFTVAKCRIINEHTIGILKNRWFSLKEIRLQLNKNSDNGWLCKWIVACALLHNFVHDANDPWTAEDMGDCPFEPSDDIPCDAAQNRGRSRHSVVAGRLLLQRVKNHALAYNRQPGGCPSQGG